MCRKEGGGTSLQQNACFLAASSSTRRGMVRLSQLPAHETLFYFNLGRRNRPFVDVVQQEGRPAARRGNDDGKNDGRHRRRRAMHQRLAPHERTHGSLAQGRSRLYPQ